MSVDVKGAIILAQNLKVSLIHTATCIEKLGLYYDTVESILKNAKICCKPTDVYFVNNMNKAYDFVLREIDYNDCLMLIRELNKICADDLFTQSGQLRTQNVSIGGTSWVPDIPIESVVCDEIKQINSIADPVEKALEYFCYLTRAQLFIDGNKRVAQLMTNKVLIESGVGVLSIPPYAMAELKRRLIHYYETGDSNELKSLLREYIERV